MSIPEVLVTTGPILVSISVEIIIDLGKFSFKRYHPTSPTRSAPTSIYVMTDKLICIPNDYNKITPSVD